MHAFCKAFVLGAVSYPALELLARKRTHPSMAIAGGLSVASVYAINKALKAKSLATRCITSAAAVTAIEGAIGCAVNRHHTIWDYRHIPGNWRGQICLPYTACWLMLCTPLCLLWGRQSEAPAPQAGKEANREDTSALLHSLFSCTQMGHDNCEKLMTYIEDDAFYDVVRSQRSAYRRMLQKVEDALQEEPEGKSALQKAMAQCMIGLQTLTDRSASHLAEMMLQGGLMGVVEVQKALHAHPRASLRAKRLCAIFLQLQQDHMEALKCFL